MQYLAVEYPHRSLCIHNQTSKQGIGTAANQVKQMGATIVVVVTATVGVASLGASTLVVVTVTVPVGWMIEVKVPVVGTVVVV